MHIRRLCGLTLAVLWLRAHSDDVSDGGLHGPVKAALLLPAVFLGHVAVDALHEDAPFPESAPTAKVLLVDFQVRPPRGHGSEPIKLRLICFLICLFPISFEVKMEGVRFAPSPTS